MTDDLSTFTQRLFGRDDEPADDQPSAEPLPLEDRPTGNHSPREGANPPPRSGGGLADYVRDLFTPID
jgi:hypothetical protein